VRWLLFLSTVLANNLLDEPDDEREMKHQIGRLMARYKRRWGIENDFKRLKTFLAETQSPDHRFRYFNFAFACVLYNCWRLVDILVQLEMDGGGRGRAGNHGELVPDVCQEELRPQPTRLTPSFPVGLLGGE